MAAIAANAILSAGAVTCAFIFLHFFHRYSQAGGRVFRSWQGILVYGGVPILLACLLVAGLRLKREHKINIALMWVAVVVSVYGGELTLYLIEAPLRAHGLPVMLELRKSKNRHTLASTLSKAYGVQVDPRTASEVLDDFHAMGVDAFPVVGILKNIAQKHGGGEIGKVVASPIFPLGGISNELTVLCNENGQYVTYVSDEHGFRNPKGLWLRNHADIVTIGDSFTHGMCASTGHDFVDVIRREYPGTLNLGFTSNGPLLELSTLREYVPPLRPKLVLWFYFEGNDLLDLRDESRSALLMRYLQDRFSQDLIHRQREIDRIYVDFMENERFRQKEAREARIGKARHDVIGHVIHFVGLPRLRARLEVLLATSQRNSELASELNDLDLFREVLWRAKATVNAWGGILELVYLPDAPRFLQEYTFDKRLADRQHDNILKTATDLKIPVIDLLPAFEARRDAMSFFPFRGPGHYTDAGHRLVADVVLKSIAHSRILNPRGVIADSAPSHSDSGARGAVWRSPIRPAS